MKIYIINTNHYNPGISKREEKENSSTVISNYIKSASDKMKEFKTAKAGGVPSFSIGNNSVELISFPQPDSFSATP
jgi:hypothetical protein